MKKHTAEQYQEFSAGSLYSILEAAHRPLRLDDILRRMRVTRRSKKEILSMLSEMTRSGKVIRVRGGGYAAGESLRSFLGRISAGRGGIRFATPVRLFEDAGKCRGTEACEEGASSPRPQAKDYLPTGAEDVYVADSDLEQSDDGDARMGDIAELALLPSLHGGKRSARIRSIVCRAQNVFSVRVKRIDGESAFAVPTDSRHAFSVRIASFPDHAVPRPGDLFSVDLGRRIPLRARDARHGIRELFEGLKPVFLGRESDVAALERAVKTDNKIPTSFADSALSEAERIAEREGFLPPEYTGGTYHARPGLSLTPGRGETNLRHMPLVTIDGEDARDFDDAVCVLPCGTGFRLIVAIADVSRYVQLGSALDAEALSRSNSYYFPSSVEPMLPEALSNGVCSLRPDEDHMVLFADMAFDAGGRRQKTVFGSGAMRSHARLTYAEVQDFFDGQAEKQKDLSSDALSGQQGKDGRITGEVAHSLAAARTLAEMLIQRRERAGGLDLDIPELVCTVSEGTLLSIAPRKRLFAHRLIEAFMIAANEAVAEFLTERGMPFLYRVHPAPDPERAAELLHVFTQMGIAAEARDKIPSFSELLAASAGGDNAFIAHRLILRSLMQARYSPDMSGHFGLASRCYCHFTSPIRRYADLTVHRALKYALDPNERRCAGRDRLIRIADRCNENERTAQTAEREITRAMGCLLMKGKTGECFDAVVSGITSFGVFAELEPSRVEGMIPLDTLGNEYFLLNDSRTQLFGERTGRTIRLGDTIRVLVKEVDLAMFDIRLGMMQDGCDKNESPSWHGLREKHAHAAARSLPERRRAKGGHARNGVNKHHHEDARPQREKKRTRLEKSRVSATRRKAYGNSDDTTTRKTRKGRNI
ncbi:MAG: VacB/RNase II family 3'-5' exoribonuclease [Mailhella sp.]|nr:VacB/RNase II family 3'-5' exoribonuclease [Mailhella sp.]